MRIAVVGGCGHVGLPLAVALANVNFEVVALDVSGPAVEAVNLGKTFF